MEKINIAELLKSCPNGMELDSPIWNNIVFEEIDGNSIVIFRKSVDAKVYLTRYGEFNNIDGKCVIFPKGKTTWEGFVPPCQFKDGDIVFSGASLISIFKGIKKGYCESLHSYVSVGKNVGFNIDKDCWTLENIRLATEEEKEKLFQAIKDNGYRWDEETKTLEKLVEPKFKVGDRIRSIKCNLGNIYNVIEVKESLYVVNKNNGNGNYHIDFEIQDDLELVPNKFDISTLVPFESKVLVRNDESQYWIPAFWGCKRDDCYTTTFGWSKYCVPFAGNEHLLRTSDDCDEYFKTWK